MKFVTSAYMTNSYVVAGHKASEVRSIGKLERSFKRPIIMNFRMKEKAKNKKHKQGADTKLMNSPRKRKRLNPASESPKKSKPFPSSPSTSSSSGVSPEKSIAVSDCSFGGKTHLSVSSSSSSSSSSSDTD